MPEQLRYKIFLTNGIGDYVRTNTGDLRLFTILAEAQATAAEVGGMVQLVDDPPPGGFDRTPL